MKKISYLSASVIMLVVIAVVVTSCVKELEDYGPVQHLEPRLSISEARIFFEQYAAENVTNTDLPGMAPGNFAPQWDKAVAGAFIKEASYVDVPIVAEHSYTANFAKSNPTAGLFSPGYYSTAIAQKLVVGKNLKTGVVGCAMVTIIPAEKTATKNHEKVKNMYIHGKANSSFSGVIAYSDVTTNGTFAVDRYANGKIVARKTMYNSNKSDEENLAAMKALVGQVAVKKGKITPKFVGATIEDDAQPNGSGDHDGGEIKEVVIIGNKPEVPPIVPPTIPDVPDFRDGDEGGDDTEGGRMGDNNNNNDTKPPIDPSKTAPMAAKIFKSDKLTITHWRNLEKMVNKIIIDCAGAKLYNSLLGSNNSSTIVYGLYSSSDANGQYDPTTNTIYVRSLAKHDSDILYHEMLHALQRQDPKLDWNNSTMNIEVEAHVLQYLYAHKDRATYNGSTRLQDKFERTELALTITYLLSGTDLKGNLTVHENWFTADYVRVMNKLYKIGYDPVKYKYNPGRNSQSFFQNIMSDC